MSAPTILIVEESQLIRRKLTLMLEAEGYNVVFAADGRQALQRCLEEPPNAVLLDDNCPGLSWSDLIGWMRASQSGFSLPFFLMFDNPSAIKVRAAADAGALHVFGKPIDTASLLRALAQVFAGRFQVGQTAYVGLGDRLVRGVLEEALNDHLLSLQLLCEQDGEALPTLDVGTSCEIQLEGADRARFHYPAVVASIAADARRYVHFQLTGGASRIQPRRHLRKEIRLPIHYEFGSDRTRHLAETIDLSGGGARLRQLPAHAERDMTLSLELTLPGSTVPMTIEATIAWTKPQADGSLEAGLHFTAIAAADQIAMILFLFEGQDPGELAGLGSGTTSASAR